jgi:hypothetical protein
MALLRSAALLATLCAFTACDPVERAEGRFPEREAGTFDAAVDGGPDMGPVRDAGPLGADAGLESAAGQWVLFTEDRKCLEALGAAVESIVWSLYLVEIEEVAEEDGRVFLRQRMQLCRQELSPLVAGLRTVIPDEIPKSLPPREVSGFLLGRAAQADYLADELLDIWGGAGIGREDPLPQSPEDDRVFDQDGDGEPGVTFVLVNPLGESVCEVRVVQRTRLRLRGTVEGPGRVGGTFFSQVDKVVLDATNLLCGTDNTFVQSPSANRFVMVRADGGPGGMRLDVDNDGRVDCDDVRAAEPVLKQTGVAERSEPDDAVCR